MRRITRKQILARLFIGFFTAASLLCTVNSAVAGGSDFWGEYTIENPDYENPLVGSITNAIYPGYTSDNTVTVNLYGPTTGTVKTIYGGYSDGDGNTSGNSVIITRTKNIDVKLSDVYGGYTNNGDATENQVEINVSTIADSYIDSDDSTISYFVYGGYTNNGDATENQIEINDSTIGDSDNVYGGKVGTGTTGIGNAVSNTVIINDSIASGSTIYGGYTNNGNANSNTVEITNSKTATVWGGYILSEDSTGNTSSNTLRLTNCEINAGNIVAAFNQGTGDGVENTVEISGGIINIRNLCGAQLLSGDAILNKVTISDLDSPATYTNIIGGTVTDGNAYSNAVTLDNLKELNVNVGGGYIAGGQVVSSGEAASNTVTIKNNSSVITSSVYGVYGGYVGAGSATQNEVHIDGGTVNGSVFGGYVDADGNATDNTVEISGGSTVNGNVYGGFTTSGYADENIIKINDGSTVTGVVSSGYVFGDGNATGNTVEISGGSTVNQIVYGGYVGGGEGDATDNTVVISGDSKLTGGVIGGESSFSGDAKCNTIEISDGASVSGGIYGGDSISGDATENTVKINGGKTQDGSIYGASVNNGGNATDNTVEISGGSSVESNVYAGSVETDGDATDNTVEISGGSTVSYSVFVGYVYGDGNATDNTVKISDGSTVNYDVHGGFVNNDGNATDNTVKISDGSTILGSVYCGYVGEGDATDNTVEISGGSTVNGMVIGGYVVGSEGDSKTGNKLIIAGTGNEIGGFVEYFESVSFKLALDDDASKPMLSLGDSMDDLVKLDSELPDGLNGEKTLIDGRTLNYDTVIYTINGTAVDGDKSLTVVKKNENSVNIGFYKYDLSESAIKLNAESTVAAIFEQSGKDPVSTDDKKIVVTSEMANTYTRIYGAFNTNGGNATDATVELSEAVSNENLTIYGGYSTGSGVDVTTGNTLNVLKNGNKINNILNFSKLDFSLDSDNSNNPTMLSLAADTVDLSNASINVNLTNALAEGQTVTLLGAAQQLNLSDDKLTIDGKALGVDLSLNIVKKVEEKYVNVGGYSLEKDIGKLSIKAKDAILTGRYRNGAEDLSVEKFELTNDLSKFKNIYGSYSADNSAAEGGKLFISEKADLSDTTLIGGKSAGNGEVKNNTLEISSSAAGSKVKAINSFSDINFTLGSDIAAGTTMLSTVDKVALDGVSVNTEMSGISLAKGEKIILLDNADKSTAEFKLNGSTGDMTTVEKNSNFVAVSSVGYNTDDNKIAIECKDSFATGCYIDEKGQTAGNTTLTLGSSAASNMRAGYERASEAAPDMSKYSDIYGIYSAGEKDPTDPIKVNIVSAIDYSNSVLHGGYKNGNRYAKNTNLIIDSLNVKLKGVTDFETMTFNLPAETKSGDTMLKVTDEVDMEPTKTVGVEASKATGLKAGDSVNLIDSDGGIKNFGSQEITISGLTDKNGEVSVKDKALVLDLKGEKPNDNTKAPVEGISAAVALVSQANTLASEDLNKNMIAVTAGSAGISRTFAAMNGGHNKYETGSYVEADSWNVGFGIAKKGMSSKNTDTTYGLFFQYGKSSFDTHNDGGYRGDGDSKMFGAGLMFHQEARSKYYYEGNVYAGKVDAKWNSKDGGYDDKATYYGMTFGMGRKHNAGGNKTMDVYGRYSFNHVGSMNGNLNGLQYDFDSTSSHNLRLGLRMEYAQKNTAKAYWGLAWEHEFAGDSTATVATLGRTESPTLKGNTGIAEVGYEWKRGDWNYSINAEGSFGKREGVTGSFNINYNF